MVTNFQRKCSSSDCHAEKTRFSQKVFEICTFTCNSSVKQCGKTTVYTTTVPCTVQSSSIHSLVLFCLFSLWFAFPFAIRPSEINNLNITVTHSLSLIEWIEYIYSTFPYGMISLDPVGFDYISSSDRGVLICISHSNSHWSERSLKNHGEWEEMYLARCVL